MKGVIQYTLHSKEVDMVTRNLVFNSSLEHTHLGAQSIVAPIIALFKTVYSMTCMQAAN